MLQTHCQWLFRGCSNLQSCNQDAASLQIDCKSVITAADKLQLQTIHDIAAGFKLSELQRSLAGIGKKTADRQVRCTVKLKHSIPNGNSNSQIKICAAGFRRGKGQVTIVCWLLLQEEHF